MYTHHPKKAHTLAAALFFPCRTKRVLSLPSSEKNLERKRQSVIHYYSSIDYMYYSPCDLCLDVYSVGEGPTESGEATTGEGAGGSPS